MVLSDHNFIRVLLETHTDNYECSSQRAPSSISTAVFTNRRGRMTKQVKISDVHYSMLKGIGKKWRISPEDLLAELIQEAYSNKKKRG